jgi:coenzyme F420-dependent glucose-6-phosphate dehydrogenase
MHIGYHASHEQFAPGRLIELVKAAEKAGFTAGMCSDHFKPWNNRQNESGFAWSWLGAALQGTSLPFGVVSAPGQRYHPAIIAQAAATLAEMFPDRFWIAVGSGQLMNESITGDRWPTKKERNERLLECVRIFRALWNGQTVTHHGRVRVEEAKLYSLPERPPLLFGAALTPETAAWVGEWADGLITVSAQEEQLNELIKAFHSGGGKGKPMYMQMKISYALTEEEALKGAWDQWRSTILKSSVNTELRSPEVLDAAAEFVKPEDMRDYVHISSDINKYVDWIDKYIGMGFENIYVHNVNLDQQSFIDDFGEHVLPALLTSRDVSAGK